MFPTKYEDCNDPGIPPSEKLRQSQRLHSVNKQSNSGSGSEASQTPDSDIDKGPAEEEANYGKRKLRKCSSLSELNDIMACLLPKDQRWDPKTAKKIKAAAVEVPPWTDKSSSTPYSSCDLKWLGTPIWPPENQKHGPFEQEPIGKGRQDNCRCGLPGSVVCTRLHVAERRVQLKRELGSAFHSWRFDCMGEEVALSWTEEEAHKFKTVVCLNPPSHETDFWDQLHCSFPSKGTKKLVSYYFNVFVLGRRSYQNRVTPNNIDSDDEEPEFGFLSMPFGHDAINVDAPKSNFCAQNAQCVDLDD